MAGLSTVHSPHPWNMMLVYMHTGISCADASSTRRTMREGVTNPVYIWLTGFLSEPRSLAVWMVLSHITTAKCCKTTIDSERIDETVIASSYHLRYFEMAQGVLAQSPIFGIHVYSKHSAAATRTKFPMLLHARPLLQRQTFASTHDKIKTPPSHIARAAEQGISTTTSPAEARDDDVGSL